MKRVFVLCEGQTEETFVRDVLGPHLEAFDVFTKQVVLKTKRVKAGGAFRGGVTSTQQVLNDVAHLLADSDVSAVTTILDYYGLPTDFPGMATRPPASAIARVSHVEDAWAARVNDRRFIPHLVLHEYEAWIFSDPARCAWVFEDPRLPAQLFGVATTCGGAEMINEDPQTAPSKRLMAMMPSYRKTLHGPMAVAAIGLAAIREACPHADAWLKRLEALHATTGS